jgi:hypothetical protein
MSSFCRSCGNPLDEGSRFCGKCGVQTSQSQQQPAPSASPTPAAPPAAATPKKGLSTGAKLGITAGVIVLVCAGAAVAGIFYAAHRVSQKFHEMKAEITGGTDTSPAAASTSAASSESRSAGDPCRYLSKQDVGAAISIEIVKTQADSDSCSYLAKGNARDMAAKHASAIVGAKGGNKDTQKFAEQFAATIFNSMPQDKQDTTDDGSGNVPVLVIGVSDSPNASAEMKLNAKVLGNLGGQGRDLDIGDEAFSSSDGLIMFRKGGKVIRIMYTTCPCGTKDVIPLAKKLADSL